MKHIVLAVLLFCSSVILIPSFANADLFIVESLYQSIRGDNTLPYQTGNGTIRLDEHFFHESTSSVAYLHDRVTGGQATLSSTFDGNQFRANLFTGFDLQGQGPNGYDGCYANLDLIFKPTMVSEWQFELYSGYAITLEDLTADTLLINSVGHLLNFVLTLSPTHEYKLHMNSDGYDEDSRNFSRICATITPNPGPPITPIPEPSPIFLLGTGLLGLVMCKIERASLLLLQVYSNTLKGTGK